LTKVTKTGDLGVYLLFVAAAPEKIRYLGLFSRLFMWMKILKTRKSGWSTMKEELQQILQALLQSSCPREIFTMSLHSLVPLPDLFERTNGIHNAWMYPEERFFRRVKNALKAYKSPIYTICKKMAMIEALDKKFDASTIPFLRGSRDSIFLNNVYFSVNDKNNIISCKGQLGIVQSFDVTASTVTVKLLKQSNRKWYGIGWYMREQLGDESSTTVFQLSDCHQKNYIKSRFDDTTDLMIEL